MLAECDGAGVDGGTDDGEVRTPHIGIRRERGPMGSWARGPHRFEAVLYDATGHGWVLPLGLPAAAINNALLAVAA